MKKYKLGLALSGGGTKGFAHVGVIRALHDFGLKPDVVAGVSAGAIVAGFYGCGMTPAQMLEAFGQMKLSNLMAAAVPTDGLFRIDKFRDFYDAHTPIKRIEQLQVPTRIVATCLDTYSSEVFTSGPLADCVVASSSLPVVIKPARVGDRTYLDGGVLHNLPAFALRDDCELVLGVNVSPMNTTPFKSTLADIAYRSYRMMMTNNTRQDMALCDAVIEVDALQEASNFELKKMRQNATAGYFAAMRVLQNSDALKQLRNEQQQQ